jgi:hypothetical protein
MRARISRWEQGAKPAVGKLNSSSRWRKREQTSCALTLRTLDIKVCKKVKVKFSNPLKNAKNCF